MGIFIELTVQEKQCLGLPAGQKLFLELIPPEHTPIVVLRKEKPFKQLGVMRVGDKMITFSELSLEWLEMAYPHIKNLATIEGFPAHIKAIEARIKGSF